jgi:hypothetical protein
VSPTPHLSVSMVSETIFIGTEQVGSLTHWILTNRSAAIFENYVAEIRLDGKAVQLALWDTACVMVVFPVSRF